MMNLHGIKLGCRHLLKVNGSRVVTVPALWLKQFGPGKVESVEIEIDDNKNLVLKPKITYEGTVEATA